MATIGLTPSDSSTRHRYRKFRRHSSKGNSCFTVAAETSLAMLEQDYQPHVVYSLNKHGRWRLLEKASDNPASLFDASAPPQLQVTVSDASPQQHGHQFYQRGEEETIDINQAGRKRRKRLNINSLRRTAGGSEDSSVTRVDFVDGNRRLKRADRLPSNSQGVFFKISKGSRQRQMLSGFVKDVVAEMEVESEWEEEEREEEEEKMEEVEDDEVFLPQPSQRSLADFTVISRSEKASKSQRKSTPSSSSSPSSFRPKSSPLPAPDHFSEPSEQKTDESQVTSSPSMEDSVKMIPTFVPKLSEDLSSGALERQFGAAFVDGSSSPRMFAINISEKLRAKRRLPALPKPRSLHAYVVFEELGERLALRLNCFVNDDPASEIQLPDLSHLHDLGSLVDACVDFCANNYPTTLTTEPRQQLLIVSGFRIPLDGRTAMKMVPLEVELPAAQVCSASVGTAEANCGVCLDSLDPGSFCAMSACGHHFCETCWSQHLLSEIAAGRKEFRCPGFNCDKPVDLVTRLRHVSVTVQRAHRQRVLSAMLESDPDLVWCPNALCSRPIRLLGLSRARAEHSPIPLNAFCSCATVFCPDCRQEAHWPASCDVYRAFADQLRRLGDWKPLWAFNDYKPMHVLTKPCPSCRMRWEKNGGCNHMTCSSCRTDYCWFCGVQRVGHVEPFPCPKGIAFTREKISDRTAILPTHSSRREASAQRSAEYCEALHLRLLANSASLTNLRRQYAKLIRKAVPANGVLGQAIVLALLRSVADCTRAAQFSMVAAMVERNRERARILRSFAGRFHSMSETALDALRAVSEQENGKTKAEVLHRLRACREGGRSTARMLQAILIGWSKRDRAE